ncbi:hypothetical protein [Streptomyces canus]|uniref:hypothetical protein n=1 Tax=Streptomyces canus TaxID=58343 RepID=UPI0036E1A0B2
MQEDFVTALAGLRELAGQPTYETISRDCGVARATVGDWFGGKSVPKQPELLQKVALALRKRIVNTQAAQGWSSEQAARFEQLKPQYLEALRAAAHAPGAASLQRLRRLTVQALQDLDVVLEPNVRFPLGIRLEELHVTRGLEQIVLGAVPERCAQLVAGEPGSGKTTVLWSLQRTLSQQPGVEALFVKATFLLDALRPDAAASPTALSVEEIVDAVAHCDSIGVRPVLLVDTLDLLMHSPDGQTLVTGLLEAMRRQGVAVVVSCRPGEATQLPFEAFDDENAGEEASEASAVRRRDAYLRPQLMLGWYSARERGDAVARHARVFCPDRLYGPGAASRLEADITEAVYRDLPLREVCDNPLYLRLLFDIYAPNPPVKEVDVASLFDELRRRRVECDDRAGETDRTSGTLADRSVLDTARALARYMLAANTLEFGTRADGHHLEMLLPHKAWEDISTDLAELRRRGLLVAIPETSSVRFFHQTFFEYMVADYLRTARRSRELIDRMREHPDDLVLAAVAGQLVPREMPGMAEDLLTLLLADRRLASVGIEFYAQLPSPGRVTATARQALRSLPPEAVKRFLKVLPGRRHHDAERWAGDLTAIWDLTGEPDYNGAKSVRLQVLDAVRRLMHQDPERAIEFLDEDNRLGWLIDLPAQHLSTHKERFLGLLGAAFPHDTDQSLAWMTVVCRRMISGGKYGVAAEVIRAAAAEAARIRDPGRRAQAYRQTLHTFEALLKDRERGSKKSLYLEPVEQATGMVWATCQLLLPAERLAPVVTDVLAAPLDQALERARLHGAGLVAGHLEDPAAKKVVAQLVGCPSPAAQTAVSDHVLVPALGRGRSSPFARELQTACREALRALPSPEYVGERRAVPAWFADAAVKACPAPDILLQLLPDDMPVSVWLDVEGLAELLIPAAVAGHPQALAALQEWVSNRDIRSTAATEAAQGSIRAALLDAVADHPALLSHLINEAALLERSSFLTSALDAAGQRGQQPSSDDQHRLDALLQLWCASANKGLRNEGYRVWRALIDHAGWEPPPAADVLDILQHTTVGQPLHTTALTVTQSAAQTARWSHTHALPLLEHLTALLRHRSDTGTQVSAKDELALVRHSVVLIWARLAPVDEDTQRAQALNTLLDLVVPDGDTTHRHINTDVREVGRLLQRIAEVHPADAAQGLLSLSARLHASQPQAAGLTNDLAPRLRTLLVTLLDKLGPTARKQLIVSLAAREVAIARKAVEVFAQTHETSLTTPPAWFRSLTDREDLPTVVRETITARLRIHVRMRCGGPWPELLQHPPISGAAVSS